MSLALDTILADTDEMLEICVEIDSAERTDGTLRTWYLSTNIRETGSSETPANTTFLPYIKRGGTLGPLSQSLTADVQLSGIVQASYGTLTLLQSNPDEDNLSEMHDYVFAGYQCRIKIGRQSNAYAAFETYRTVEINIDPTIELVSSGLQAVFSLRSPLERMVNESLISKKYVGIPTCAEVLTTTAVAQASYNAAHDVTSFTIMYKVLVVSNPPADRNLIAKAVSTTNSNFVMNFRTTGVIRCLASVGGVETQFHLSSDNLADGTFHTIIWGLLDKTTSYLAIDQKIISTFTPSGSVDLPSTGVRMARFLIGKHVDARIYNHYIPPDEAHNLASVRSDGQDFGCVGSWRFDDGGSATAVNDYSPTGADATWTGVLNTDYQWTFTDLGEPELAGRPYPILAGNVLNAPATLIDTNRHRVRGNIDAVDWHTLMSNTTLTVRSQGTVLVGEGVDYTAPTDGGDGVFSFTSAEDEPITYDLINNGIDEENVYPSNVAKNLLTHRTRLSAGQIRNVDPLTILCPWPCGFWTDQETTAAQALKSILGESGLHYYEKEDGAIFFDMLLPPTGYGPYGEPCLDFKGYHLGGVEFGDIGDLPSSGTIAQWVKVHLIDQTTYNYSGSDVIFVSKGANYQIALQTTGVNAGKIKFNIASTDLRTSPGFLSPHQWYFLACVFDDTANTMKIYLSPKGGTLAEIASGSNALSATINSNPLQLGGTGYSWCSIQHLQIWSEAKNLSQLQALMSTPPIGNEPNLSVYIPANEGAGDPKEIVSGTFGALTGSSLVPVWCPKLVINLNETPSVRLSDFHRTSPRHDIAVKYVKNRFKMNNSDVDSGVSANNRLALTREGLEQSFYSQVIRDRFPGSKRAVFDSPITDQESAQRLLRVMTRRFDINGFIGTLTFPPGLNISRLACGFQIGDEIGLVGKIPKSINTAKSFRVIATTPDPLQLKTTLGILSM